MYGVVCMLCMYGFKQKFALLPKNKKCKIQFCIPLFLFFKGCIGALKLELEGTFEEFDFYEL